MRKEKGITLIALVITIIVLLILAGVAISMLSGENGILKKAADAKTKTEDAKRDESSKLSQYEGVLNKYSGKRWSLVTDESGKVTGVTDGKTTIKIGAQINYDPYTGVDGDYLKITTLETKNGYEDQTFEIKDNDKQKLTWQVLGVDDNGQILIIPTTNVKNEKGEIQYLYLGNKLVDVDNNSEKAQERGKRGAQYGAEEVNNVCSIYGFGKGAVGARSVQVEDIDKLTKYEKTEEYEKEYTYTKTGFKYLQGNEWKEINTSNPTVTLKNTNYSYDMSSDPYKTNLGQVYDLITKDTDDPQYYWLGSSAINANSGYTSYGVTSVDYSSVNFGLLFRSDGYADYYYSGLRPAVSLKSDIQLNETETDSGIYDIK